MRKIYEMQLEAEFERTQDLGQMFKRLKKMRLKGLIGHTEYTIKRQWIEEKKRTRKKPNPERDLNKLIEGLEAELELRKNVVILSTETVEMIVDELKGKRSLFNRLNDDMVLPERQAVVRFGNEEVTFDVETEDGKTISINQTWDGITIKRSDG